MKLVGLSGRISLEFKRSLDVYERNDLAFVGKMLKILIFKNRERYRDCTSDYHCEYIVSITKFTISNDNEYGDWEVFETKISEELSEFQGVPDVLINKLKEWYVGGPLTGHDPDIKKVPKEHRKYVRGQLGNLRISLREH